MNKTESLKSGTAIGTKQLVIDIKQLPIGSRQQEKGILQDTIGQTIGDRSECLNRLECLYRLEFHDRSEYLCRLVSIQI